MATQWFSGAPLPDLIDRLMAAQWFSGAPLPGLIDRLMATQWFSGQAAARGTTVYLVNQRIDMVPKRLGEDLCSLHEKVDRLAFSILWEMVRGDGSEPPARSRPFSPSLARFRPLSPSLALSCPLSPHLARSRPLSPSLPPLSRPSLLPVLALQRPLSPSLARVAGSES